MLEVCSRLGIKTGLDKIIFQLIFIIWFLANPFSAFLFYIGTFVR